MIFIPLQHGRLDMVLGALVGFLLAITIHGEAQIFVSHLARKKGITSSFRYDFNPTHYLDVLGIPVFIMAGWTWTRLPRLSWDEMGDHCLYPLAVHMAGPLGNLLLAGVLGTLHDILIPSPLFQVAIAINIQTGVANALLPLPPLALGRGLERILRGRDHPNPWMGWIGAILITLIAAWETIHGGGMVTGVTARISGSVYRLLMGGPA